MLEPSHTCSRDLAPVPDNSHVLWVSNIDPDGFMYYLECNYGYQYSTSNEGLLFCNVTTGMWDDEQAGNCTGELQDFSIEPKFKLRY